MAQLNALQHLEHLEQEIIHLLNQRIDLLSELLGSGEMPTLETQLAMAQPLLEETNLSELAWQSVLVHSMAALTQAPSPVAQSVKKTRRVTVVGGGGAMGAVFVERLMALGHRVSILEHDGWDRADVLLGRADLVIVAVPLKSMVPVIQRVGPYLSAQTVLADIASTKTEVIEAMLSAHTGPVVGLHPMFGPGGASFLGQKFVVCPGRYLPRCQWVLDLIESDGGTLISCSAAEHDAMMVSVQAIRFFSNFSLGTFFAKAGIDIERSFEFASPLYRMEMTTISRLVAQDAALYVDILLASPDRCEAIAHLVDTFAHLAQLVKQRDRDSLIAEFEHTRQAFMSGASRSLSESNYLLNNLSVLLAAKHVEAPDSSKALDVAA